MNEPSNWLARPWLVTRGFWYTLLLVALMVLLLFLAVSEVRVSGQGPEPGPDLGDAPDSDFNHPGMDNTAYFAPPFPAPILGHFPTVWESAPPGHPSGPRHADVSLFWLGEWASHEEEADIGPDDDTVNNILHQGNDVADLDRDDDGWLNRELYMPDCRESTLRVRISRGDPQYEGPMFLNVWFDGNRDGDWADWEVCDEQRVASEWIVRNHVIPANAVPPHGFLVIEVPTFLVMNDDPTKPAWMRFTLSDREAPLIPGTALADGRGPMFPDRFELGETEDYLVEGFQGGEPGEISIDKAVSHGSVGVGQVFTYSVYLSSAAVGTAPAETEMLDVLPAAVTLVDGPWVTELIPSANPLVAMFISGIGPSGAVAWQGTLSPGASIRIDYQVQVRYCPQLRLIENRAVAIQVDGTLVDAGTTVEVDCTPPDTEINLVKRIVPPDAEPTDELHVLPGHEIAFRLVLSSTGDLAHTVHISDDLPPGLVAHAASASSGVAGIANSGRTVVWDGELGPRNRPVIIHIWTELTGEAECNDALRNQAVWRTHFADGESNTVALVLVCRDLGDAPDSSNHFAVQMSAYPGVAAEFPTVFGVGPPDRGPMHRHPRPLHLGRYVSAEVEADVGPDVDGPNNIIPPRDLADLDRGDDGLELDKMNFQHCQQHRFPVWVNVAPAVIPALRETEGLAFLNVWLDGDHSGTWADVHQCDDINAPEHIVIDFPVDIAALGPGLHQVWVTTDGPVFWPATAGAAWLRVTLSESESNKTYAGGTYGDGRGYDTPFVFGETEDYLLRSSDDLQPDPAVEKRVFVHPMFDREGLEWRPFWEVGWVVEYGNAGAAAAHNVQVVDTYDTGGIPLVLGPEVRTIPPLTYTVSGDEFTFDVGTLLPSQGGHIFIHAALPISTTPGAIVTNTVTIVADRDANPANNTHTVTATIPFLPPRIIFPRPGTICTDTFTITGRVQAVPMPALMDVDVIVDGAVHETVHPDNLGRWSSGVTGLADGDHTIWAVAHYMGMTSPPSHPIKIIVDTALPWSPVTLRFVDQDGFVLLPRDREGRADETGWAIFLRPNRTYAVTVYLCCTDPNARVTLEVAGQTIVLTDPDGDHWYEASFTTPATVSGSVELCVTCHLIRRCSDGEILIDPEGTVYDKETEQELAGAEVACFEEQADGGDGGYFSLWPAGDFGQANPQTTGLDGYYSFYTPAGTYRVGVTKDGYQSHLSPDLVVVDEPVHYDVYLAPEIAEEADYVITIGPLGYDPPVLIAEPGSVIEWVNLDSAPHASTSITPTLQAGSLAIAAFDSGDAWDSGLLGTGESYKYRLETAGTYTYQDGDNSGLSGVIFAESFLYLPLVLVNQP